MLCNLLTKMSSSSCSMASRASHRLRQLEGCISRQSPALAAAASNCGMSSTSARSMTNFTMPNDPGKNLPTRHLAKGDALPPQQEGSLRLFSMKFCPYALRPRLVLAAKGIAYETINCNLKEKPEFLLERNPKGLVPVLEYQGHVYSESLIICDLLDELFPHRPLYPVEPFSKAKDKQTMDFFSCFLTRLLHKMSKYKDDVDPEVAAKFFDAMQRMEEDLQSRGTAFFSGIRAGMVDYMCWPWFERMSQGSSAILVNYPGLKAYIERMHQDDAVRKVYIPPEQFNRFFENLFAGNPVYDF